MKKFERKAQSERKHGPLSISGASKAPVAPPTRRPGWKGPSYVKKVVRPQAPVKETGPKIQEHIIPDKLQQTILDVFREALPASNDFEALKPALRELKEALDERDVERAFATEESLENYALRWDPSKALVLSNIMAWICREFEEEDWVKHFMGDSERGGPVHAVTFGRGAAEYMALAAALKHLRPDAADQVQADEAVPVDSKSETSHPLSASDVSKPLPNSATPLLDICQVDVNNWSSVISKLDHLLTTAPVLSQYASAKAKATNRAHILPHAVKWNLARHDALECEADALRFMIGPDPTLITLVFTLSDLYSTSIAKTSAFLLKLTAAAPRGSLLLIVDDIGAQIRRDAKETEEKQCPMDWLMYRVLVPKQPQQKHKDDEQVDETPWVKLVEERENSFKLAGGLRYPASLENTRFQMHLLRRQ